MKIRMGTVEGWVVTHDGETIKSGFQNDLEAVGWLHQRVGYSVDHAVKHEGWDIVLVKGGKVAYSYRHAPGSAQLGAIELVELGAHRPEGSEGTAYIDPVGHGWYKVRWWSEDEQRYYFLIKKPSKAEAIAYARARGMKPVDMEGSKLGSHKIPWQPGRRSLTAKQKKNPNLIPIYPSFVDAYLEAALWSSGVGDDEKHLDDQGYSIHDFAQEAVDEAVKDSNKFIRANLQLLEAVGTMEEHGHDFWLTRNHHGAGFWDRGYGNVGKLLTKSAHTYGDVNAYAGDDGKIYFQ